MIVLWISFFFIFHDVRGEPPEEVIKYVSKDANGHHRFTPPMCCQFCGAGSSYMDFVYTEGRCLHYLNASSIVPIPVSAIEEAHVLHVHRSSCCFFCGYSPDKYVFKNTDSAGHCQLHEVADSTPQIKCVLCEGLVVAIKELVESEKDAIRDQVMVYCDQTVVLRRWCRKMIETHLDSIIFFIESQLHLNEICYKYIKACPAPDNSTLTAWRSRGTILEPRIDGPPMDPEEILSIAEITKNNIGQFVHLENLNPERHEENLKFLAKYGLIYNSHSCKACGAGVSLIKQKSMIDGYVWRCSYCKKQKKYNKISVRAGSFFFGLKKPLGLILATAATFIGDPTLSLDDITSVILIERPTLIHYENYFLDVVQLIITNRASNLVGGQNKIVDVERTIIYSQKYSDEQKDNRAFTQCIVFLERGSASYAVAEVGNFDSDSLAEAVQLHVQDGTKVASTEFQAIGGARGAQTAFDSRYPGKTTKFYEFDAIPVRSVEATKWNTIKNSYMEATRKNRQRASLLLAYVLTRTSIKPFNTFLYGLSLYNPNDEAL